MDHNENPRSEQPDDLEDAAQPAGAGDNDDNDVHEANIPVHGDEKLADDLAKKAYGDKDNDGEGDIPNAPFP
jgi:hypothetical protein